MDFIQMEHQLQITTNTPGRLRWITLQYIQTNVIGLGKIAVSLVR